MAADGNTVLDTDLVAAVGAWFAGREDLYARREPWVACGGGDDAQSQLLAAFGRDPRGRAQPTDSAPDLLGE